MAFLLLRGVYMIKVNKFFLLNMLLLCSSAYSMELEKTKRVVVYSHGFGESDERSQIVFCGGSLDDLSAGENKVKKCENSGGILTFHKNNTFKKYFPNGSAEELVGDDNYFFSASGAMGFAYLGDSLSMFSYPDAPGQIKKAVFYTQPAVIKLAEHLHGQVEAGNASIILVGRSCGAGTALNCLEKLVNYQDNVAYFQNSKVDSQEKAQAIIAAINNGALIETAPFLSLKKANAVAIPSAIASGLTFAAATTAAYYYGSDMVAHDPEAAKLGLMGTGLLAYCLMGDCVKNVYASGIVNTIVPIMSNGHFDPSHQQPLDAVDGLRRKLTCPILLHFNAQDGVLENPDYDTIKVYDALAGDNTHIIITNDAGHNSCSSQFQNALTNFKTKYLDGGMVDLSKTKQTVAEFKNKIYPWGFISHMFSKKYAISLVALLSVLPLYHVICNNFAH